MKIVRPTLLLDEKRCRANIRRMVDKAKRNHVALRPHFKTHQSHEIGRWFREEGVTACTVSSVQMAAYFEADGWKDITVAFPLNPLEVDEINRMAASIKLNLAIVSADGLRQLLPGLKQKVYCFIEIDTGYGRSGVPANDTSTIDELLSVISASPLLNFQGFLTHAGQSYSCRSGPEIIKVHQQTTALMKKVAAKYRPTNPDLVVSVGDTPTCSAASDFNEVQEIRPGNFVFYDLMQRGIGSCTNENIAIALACPVVAVYPSRNEVIIHGGGVHLSKDFLRQDDGSLMFGQAVRLTENGWSLPTSMILKSLSQEHGVLKVSPEDMATIQPGMVLGILPVHSCMTADVMGEYFTLSGQRISMMTKPGFTKAS